MVKHIYDKQSVWNMGECRRYRGNYGASIIIKRILLGLLRKRSYVLTGNEEVIYHQRRLCFFKHSFASYTDYHIREIGTMDQRLDNSYVVCGEIETEYLYSDEESVYGRHFVRRLVIPACFTDMSGIGLALKRLNRSS